MAVQCYIGMWGELMLALNITLNNPDQVSQAIRLRGYFDISISGVISAGSIYIERTLENYNDDNLTDFNVCNEFVEQKEVVAMTAAAWVRFRSSSDFSGNAKCIISKQ